MTTLVIEQPNYVPWLGYYDLIDRSDVWVWYDDVQYTRRDWRNRNRVAGDGDPLWLSIPVRAQDHHNRRICEIEVDHDQPWVRKHLSTLRHLYGRAPFFEPVFELVRRHLEDAPPLLADLTIGLNQELCRWLGIESRFLRSSRISGIEGSKTRRILSICLLVGAEVYLSGPSARSYLEPESFARHGIRLQYIQYEYDGYPRCGRALRTDLSILDPLVWIGPSATLQLIRGHRRVDRATASR